MDVKMRFDQCAQYVEIADLCAIFSKLRSTYGKQAERLHELYCHCAVKVQADAAERTRKVGRQDAYDEYH